MGPEQNHLNSDIRKIIDLLKKEDRGFTYREVQSKLGISILASSALAMALRNNSKIAVENDALRFVPHYSIRSVEDLRAVLLAAEGKEGVEVAKLVESPVDVAQFIAALRGEGVLITLKDMDGSEILFYDSQPSTAVVRPAIKELWNSVKIPSYHSIIEELNLAGLKSGYGQVAKKRAVVKKETKKRSQRRIKVTNTHVEGLDLTGMNDSE
ncbi:transcription initiation factor TFIIE subunit beta [Pancytospora philotis]|nr:transcription initiation factor TFIIE subunit beta [Pancytospora philotis]